MGDDALLKSWNLTVGLDRGWFHLLTDDPYTPSETEQMRVRDKAVAGEGIAQHWGLIVVNSPHLVNYDMKLRVEVLGDHPDDDLALWQEAFETDLSVGRSGLVYESHTLSSFVVPVPIGDYHALITASGFSTRDRPSSTSPGDHWRIQLWPCREGHQAHRLKAWTDSDDIDAEAG
jgi:hypothetical protein